jgi:hypothetical protein
MWPGVHYRTRADGVRSIRKLPHSLDLIATETTMWQIVHRYHGAAVSHAPMPSTPTCTCASLPAPPLKRCMVGGMEGSSPEFTMLRCVPVFIDYQGMA